MVSKLTEVPSGFEEDGNLLEQYPKVPFMTLKLPCLSPRSHTPREELMYFHQATYGPVHTENAVSLPGGPCKMKGGECGQPQSVPWVGESLARQGPTEGTRVVSWIGGSKGGLRRCCL